jgi:hypothetical protein
MLQNFKSALDLLLSARYSICLLCLWAIITIAVFRHHDSSKLLLFSSNIGGSALNQVHDLPSLVHLLLVVGVRCVIGS